nr:metacaspase-9 [Ipomoea batatas]
METEQKKSMKRMAVLVGCNYENNSVFKLNGCRNDVLAMKEVLISRFGFKPDCIEVLTDEEGSPVLPTAANIKSTLLRMVARSEPGDVLFFHFSGHGILIESLNEEAILGHDLNVITSVDFRHIVKGVPIGATFTILSDSCHSGGLIDKEKEQIGPCDHPTCGNETPEPPPNTQVKSVPFEFLLRHLSSITKLTTRDIAPHHLELFGDHASLSFKQVDKRPEPLDADEGILLSGCQANEVSRDVPTKEGQPPRGAFSYAVETVLKEHPGPLSNRELVLLARKVIKKYQLPQHPCLYCCDGNADAVFLRQS